MPDLQELVRTIQSQGMPLFYVQVHEVQKLLMQIAVLEAALAERDRELLMLRHHGRPEGIAAVLAAKAAKEK